MGASEMELFGFKKLVPDKIGKSIVECPFLTNQIVLPFRSIDAVS
jgi:hypothetical protein